MTDPTPTPTGPKRLVRRRQDKVLGGVCAGIADYLGVDPTLVRILTVAGAILGFGSIVLVYIALWIVLPQE